MAVELKETDQEARAEWLAGLKPVAPGTTQRLQALLERMRTRYGTVKVSPAELLHEAREEGLE